ncbi:hypothetical protein L0665_10150 [Methanogenium marinum]|uniref:Uncharacterized protein n=1 Tax=Methanogenium marinum TaxID=348610 RepID=A0A9Q4PYM3_9EURY|nr:hypothetical protein [Methanogenium marinum]MDE4908968.1 hypothetical protein [Methanogenium marinum]
MKKEGIKSGIPPILSSPTFTISLIKEKNMTYDWRELLYPAEWGFRFFIASMLVALVSHFATMEFVLLFYLMTAGCAFCFLLQLRIAILSILGRIPTSG